MQQRRKLTAKRLRPTTAMLSALAVVGSTLVGIQATNVLRTDGSAIDPVTPSVATTNLADGENIVVEDSAIASQGGVPGPRTVKEFSKEDPFSMVAVTWEGNKDVAVFVRALRGDGTWSEWYDTDPYDLSDVTGSAKQGTEPVFVEPTTKVQIAMSGVDFYADEAEAGTSDADAGTEQTNNATDAAAGSSDQNSAAGSTTATQEPTAANQKSSIISSDSQQAGSAPTPVDYDTIAPVAEVSDPNNYDVVFIDGGESQLPENGINLTADSDGMPRVISRAGWGANESLRCRQAQYFDGGVSGLTVHHTAGSNNYTEAQAPGIVRGVYVYHAQTLGWCDVGYQSMVDKYGNIYEGRYGGLNKDVYGAHAGGFNRNTWAVSMLGNYETAPTTTTMIESVGQLLGWRAAVAGLDPTGSNTHVSEGTSYSKYSAGTSVNLPNIFAHRDVGLTTCPGDYGYAQMGNIRAIAKSKYDSIVSGQATSPSTQAAVPEQSAAATTSSSAATTSATATSSAADVTVATTTPTGSGNLASAQSVTATTSATVSPQPNNTAAASPSTVALPADVATATPSASAPRTNGSYGQTPTQAVAYFNQLLQKPSLETATDAVNSLAALGLRAISNVGASLGDLGGLQIIEGLRLADLPAAAQDLLSRSGTSQLERAWNQVIAQYGEVLGNSRSAKQKYTSSVDGSTISYALFDNGIIVSNENTGTHALWGKLGDAWAAQGFEVGPLGMPVGEQKLEGGIYTMEFEHGSITWNPNTGSIAINQH